MDYVPKINTNRDMRCLELPYVTAKEALDCKRRFASLSVAHSKVTSFNDVWTKNFVNGAFSPSRCPLLQLIRIVGTLIMARLHDARSFSYFGK